MSRLSEMKNWNVEIETEITDNWYNSELFKFDEKIKKPIYSIDTPPPYINAPIHIGQSITYCFMDMFARYKRMKGFQVIFPLGLDRNGLPIEMSAERRYKISALNISRKEFINYCKKLLEETSETSTDTFKRLGISFTSYKESSDIGAVYKTDSPEFRSLTQNTFLELYKKGLAYEDIRINNWDPKLRTTIADSEIEYKEITSTFNNIQWKIKDSDEKIIIGTTRPELIPSCGMVIYNPKDERYRHLEGKTAISPIFGIEVPIKAHLSAEIKKGTGVVMMCSAGDLTDIQFFREQKIKPIISINIDGTMNKRAGKYEGLKVKEARKKIIEDLDEASLLIKQEQITHRTPISERSGAEVEFIEMPEFYLKQLDIKEEIRKIAESDINFYPKDSIKILDNWIDTISIDWPISRRRFYATEIPLWCSQQNGKKLVAIPTEFKYYQPWMQDVPKNAQVWINGKDTGKTVLDYKNLKWKGEERVFDTWMDSSISDLVLLKYKSDNDFFERAYPATLRPQGKEIVRTWLYYTLLRGYLETGKACFKDVWIHQHILDEKGFKMSKSKGNTIDPQILIRKYGAEALRIWAATEGDLSKIDFKCSESRIAGEKKSINKLLNVSKFVMMFDKPKKIPDLTMLDQTFIDYIENLTSQCDKYYTKYDFNHPAQDIRKFLWDTFASNYIELVKSRAYNEDKLFTERESDSAKYTLHFLLERLLILLYPIIPQVTSFIAKEKGINLLFIQWPNIKSRNLDLSLIDKLVDFNSQVWRTKKDKGISLRNSIKGIKIPKELEIFRNDLKACHNI